MLKIVYFIYSRIYFCFSVIFPWLIESSFLHPFFQNHNVFQIHIQTAYVQQWFLNPLFHTIILAYVRQKSKLLFEKILTNICSEYIIRQEHMFAEQTFLLEGYEMKKYAVAFIMSVRLISCFFGKTLAMASGESRSEALSLIHI